jgi:hypothetical protein
MANTLMEDEEGQPFPEAESALRHAKTMAAQFSENGILFGCTILLARDDDILFEVPLSHGMNQIVSETEGDYWTSSAVTLNR